MIKFKRIYIEITNKCNLRCSFCTAASRSPRVMSAEEFSHVLEKMRPYADYVYLHVQGEPLLHPQLQEILDLCERYGVQVQIVTNGTLSERFRILRHPAVRRVSFSVQSIEYFKGADPEKYMADILAFCREASSAGKPYCEIRFWRDDQFSSPLTGRAFGYLTSVCPPQETKRKNSFRLMENVYLSISNSFDWPDLNAEEGSEYGYCLGGLKQLAVLSDGTVVPCCLDAGGVISFGNIFSQSPEEIFAGRRFARMTENMKNRKLTEELCRKCTYRKRFGQ